MNKKKPEKNIDRISFQVGMINCFAEMVACGVKRLAISPPLSPEDFHVIHPLSDEIVRGFGIKSFLEKSLLITDLQSEAFTRGKYSILYYEDDRVLKSYLNLKQKKQQLENTGKYDKRAKKEISGEFMRLLSYPEAKISEKLKQKKPTSPFLLIKEQGEEP